VVVNDVDAEPAAAVVAEIEAAGGTAVADTCDLATGEGAEALIAAAVGRFGGLDVLVNNAGIVRWGGLPDISDEDFEATLAVHVRGSFAATRAAWPHLMAQGRGRIVMTTSSGLFGLPTNTSYATAKAGILGLTRSLALRGAEHGIKVNAIAPAAATRMGGDTSDPAMAPELAAPMVAWLAHDDCPVSGEVYAAGAGRFARLFVAQAPGWVADDRPTVEDVAAHWSEINAETGYEVPSDLLAWSRSFLRHLDD